MRPLSPVKDTDRPESVRQIRQIILMAPLTMPIEERDLLRDRAEDAIDMLWRALDWDNSHLRRRRHVRSSASASMKRFRHNSCFCSTRSPIASAAIARSFLDVFGKSRPEFGVQPCVRFGALDIGGGHTTMTIVTYAAGVDAPIGPRLLGAQRSAICGTTVLDQISATILLPAIARCSCNAPAAKSRYHSWRT